MGFALRVALYDYHGLEGDDGYSLSLAHLDTTELLHGLSTLELDIHPPLHFLALKGWIGTAGESLLSLRLMNILIDLVTGALIIRLAGRSISQRAAVIAGLLWLAAPLLIYSGYLIRMYTLLTLFAAGGAVCIAESRYQGRRSMGYIGAALCGLLAGYTHIVGGLIAATLALGFVVDWIASRRTWRTLVAGLAAFSVGGLLYLPYVMAVWALYRSGRPLGAEISEARFAEPVTALFSITAAIISHRALANTLAGLAFTLFLVTGSIWLARQYRPRVLPLLVLTWTGLGGMAFLAWEAGFYKARYLAPFAPLLIVVIAGTLMLMRPRWRGLALVAAICLGGWGVVADLNHSFRDDWAAAATFVQQHERSGDRIIIVPDWGQTAFQFHYRGNAPVIGLFPQVSDDVAYADVLHEQIAGAARVWYVNYQPDISDSAQHVNAWFRSQAATITDVFPAGMHLHYYDFLPRVDNVPEDAHLLDATFGNAVRLAGVYLPVDHGSARNQRLHPPSNWVQVILYWEAMTSKPDVTLRVRLTDLYAQVYGAALERDNDLLHRMSPQSWETGDMWETAYDLNLNPDTPPGTYNIEVMALDGSGNPLPAQGSDAGDSWVIAGHFVVE